MKGMAHWFRQGSRRSVRLLAITNAPASGEVASRAGKRPRRNFATALNCCSPSSGFADGSVIAVFSACGVVLGKAGPRCAWRCSSSRWRAPGLVEHGSQNWRCCLLGTRSGSVGVNSSVRLGAQHVIEPGPAESVAPSRPAASLSAVATGAVVLSSRRAG